MSDVEAPIRAEAMRLLKPWFFVAQEVEVRLREGHRGFIDVLAVPRDQRFRDFPLAIEVKLRKSMVGDGQAYWIKQASDYVGAELVGRDAPPIARTFLWMVGFEPPPPERESEFFAMMSVAHQFRVGWVHDREPQNGIVFQQGPEDIFRSAGWKTHPDDPWADKALLRLTATRQSAGVRR